MSTQELKHRKRQLWRRPIKKALLTQTCCVSRGHQLQVFCNTRDRAEDDFTARFLVWLNEYLLARSKVEVGQSSHRSFDPL